MPVGYVNLHYSTLSYWDACGIYLIKIHIQPIPYLMHSEVFRFRDVIQLF